MFMVNHNMKVPMFIIDQALFVLMSMESIDCLMTTKTPWSMWFRGHGNAITCVSLYHNLIYHALLNSNLHLTSPCRKYVRFGMCVMNVRIASMLR